jgi:hypothetical protein
MARVFGLISRPAVVSAAAVSSTMVTKVLSHIYRQEDEVVGGEN